MAADLILGRYRPLGALGKGGGGSVELAWDTRIQRRVAIKRMSLAGAGDGTRTMAGGATRASGSAALSEARTAAMLSHPSIVNVFDFETDGDDALLIMEAIEGPSLRDIIKETPPTTFDLDIVASIATAVANALDFAHANKVLHLDVKPDNVLVTPNGTAKVTDFGIAQLLDAAGLAHAVGGTIGYMPPEQLRQEALDESCDVFAFAVVVNEMLTGKNPFKSKSVEGSLKAIEAQRGDLPSAVRDDVDEAIDDVLARAMDADWRRRYATIAAFFCDLAPYLGDAEAGIAKLASIVGGDGAGSLAVHGAGADAAEDEDAYDAGADDAAGTAGTGVLSKVGPRVRLVAGRVLSAALCWWLGFVGLECLDVLGDPLAAAIAALAALAALARPPFGALVGVGMLSFGLFAGAFGTGVGDDLALGSPVLGGLALAALALWFAIVGREQLSHRGSAADVNCALVVAPLGLVGLSPLAPLVAGLALPARRASVAALLSGALAIVLGEATGSGSWLFFDPTFATAGGVLRTGVLLCDPATWVMLVAWVAAALAASLFASRGSRALAVCGVVVAVVVLLVGQTIAVTLGAVDAAAAGVLVAPSQEWMQSVFFAGAIACVGIALGMGQRAR